MLVLFVQNTTKIDPVEPISVCQSLGFWLTFCTNCIKIVRSITEEATSGNKRRHNE